MQDKITKILERIIKESYSNNGDVVIEWYIIRNILEEELLKEETKPPFELEDMTKNKLWWPNTFAMIRNIQKIYDHLFPKK